MGTNYYLQKNVCGCCGRPEKQIHIGKSSAGWAFALRVYPHDGIKDYDDWNSLILRCEETGDGIDRIVDEYGNVVLWYDMVDIIEGLDPNDCRRTSPDGRHCVGNGPGTWDLFVGEFE